MKLVVTGIMQSPLMRDGTWMETVAFESADGIKGSLSLSSHGDYKVNVGDTLSVAIEKPVEPEKPVEESQESEGGDHEQD